MPECFSWGVLNIAQQNNSILLHEPV